MRKELSENEVRQLLQNFISKFSGGILLQEGALRLLKFVYENGAGRAGKNSKNYTGVALEIFCKFCVEKAIKTAGLQGADVNNIYIKDPTNKMDKLRLDLNVYVNGKLILMQESRAWLDKPFCTLKYQVIEDVIYLPHSREVFVKDIIFPIVTFCCDVTERTLNTREYFLDMVLDNSNLEKNTSYGKPRVQIFQLSNGKRRDGYFAMGINEQGVKDYLCCLVEHFESFQK